MIRCPSCFIGSTFLVLLLHVRPVAAQDQESVKRLAARIDQLIEARWAREKVQPSAPAGDSVFLRRVSLDIVGCIPSAAESRDFRPSPRFSDTSTVNVEVTACLSGLPRIIPDFFSLRPFGSPDELGATFQMYGGLPPVAISFAEYGRPTKPGGSERVVIVSGAFVPAKALLVRPELPTVSPVRSAVTRPDLRAL